MAEPIVTLSTLAPDRQVIRIDDVDYELALSDDLSLLQRRELNKAWSRIVQIENTEAISDVEDKEYENLSRKLAGMLLLELPKSKLRAMRRSLCEAVVMAFFGNPSDPRTRMMMAMVAQNLPTGDESSPNFNGSTEATQNDGSTSPVDSSEST